MAIATPEEFRKLLDVSNVGASDDIMLFRDNKVVRTNITNLSSFAISSSGDMLASIYDPAGITEQLAGLTAVQDISNKTGLISQWTNDSGYLTSLAHTALTDMPSGSNADHDGRYYTETEISSTTGAGSDLVGMQSVASSTFSTLQDLQDIFHSTGWTSGGVINDVGSGNITVDLGTGVLRDTNSTLATLLFFDWANLTSTAIPTDTVRYVGVEYNSGSPQITIRTTNNFNNNTDFLLGSVVNEGGTLHLAQSNHAVGDHANSMLQRLSDVNQVQRDNATGGLILGETGTRNITLSAGNLWDKFNKNAIPAIDTSASDTFDRYYRNGSGGFTKEASQTQWNNTQYDDGSGSLVTMTNNRHAVKWFYLETDGNLVSMYGRAQYTTSALAGEEAPPSTLPDRVSVQAILIGRLLFQKSMGTAEAIESVFDTVFATTQAVNHANLANLAWTNSQHTGTASRLAAFDSGGAANEIDQSTDWLTQYSLEDGSRAFSGVVVGVTPTLGAHLATKDYIDSVVQGIEWQDSVKDKDLTTAPVSPTTGDRYIIAGIGGNWSAGTIDDIAEWDGSVWGFTTPSEGFATFVDDEDSQYVYTGSGWVIFGSIINHVNLQNVGTNTHTQIDTHIADDTLHFTQSSISITESQISDLQTYAVAGGAFHDGFSDFVANEHIDWTSTSSNFNTSGTTATGALTVNGNLAVDTDTLFVNSSTERVSINAGTSPDGTLHLKTNDATTNAIVLKLSSQAGRKLEILQPDGADSKSPWIIDTNNAIEFRVDGNPALIVHDNQNIGIRVVDPQAPLHVATDSVTLNADIFKLTSQDARSMQIQQPIIGDGSAPFIFQSSNAFLFQLNGDNALLMDANSDVVVYQNLTVGTSGGSPSTVHIISKVDAQLIIEADTDNVNEDDNASILLKQDGALVVARIGYTANNTLEIINETSTAGIVLGTNDITRFTIAADGDITTTSDLDVGGSVIVGDHSANASIVVKGLSNNADSARLDLIEASGFGGYMHYDGSVNDFFIGTIQSGTDVPAIKIDKNSAKVFALGDLDVVGDVSAAGFVVGNMSLGVTGANFLDWQNPAALILAGQGEVVVRFDSDSNGSTDGFNVQKAAGGFLMHIGDGTNFINKSLSINQTSSPNAALDVNGTVLADDFELNNTGLITRGVAVISKDISHEPSGIILHMTVADGYAIVDVYVEVTETWDGTTGLFTIGDGNNNAGFGALSNATLGTLGYKLTDDSDRGAYLVEEVTDDFSTKRKIYTGADTIEVFVTEGNSTQGEATIYIVVQKLK